MADKPAHHHYGLGTIFLFLMLVGSLTTRFRGASQCLHLFFAYFHLPLPVPSWSTGRLWWLRLGYYKLTRPLPSGDDWVWIVDHTVQVGPEKCLVILGLRLQDLPPCGQALTHEDVEPLTLEPVRRSNGQIVYEQLEQTQQRTGVPRQILSDQATDLDKGIATYGIEHPSTCATYDIKHKTAVLLKQALVDQDPGTWSTFTHYAGCLRRELQQTPLAALAPPPQRSKARYMNIAPLIRWCDRLLQVWLHQPERLVAVGIDPVALDQPLVGLPYYGRFLPEWATLLRLAETTEHLIRSEGLYRRVDERLAERLNFLCPTQRTQTMREHLLTFVAQQSQPAQPDERLLGSSEVIESVFGKLKVMEGDYARRGFTSLLLSVAAMVSTTTQEVIHRALETVPTRMIRQWTDEKLGISLQTQRKILFQTTDETEQKRNQLDRAA